MRSYGGQIVISLKRVARPFAAIAGMAMAVLLLGSVFAQQAPPPGTILAAGLNAPRGLHVLDDGSLLVAEGGGRVITVGTDGSINVIASGLPTESFEDPPLGTVTIGPSSALPVGGGAYVVLIGEGPGPAFQSLYLINNGIATKFRDMQEVENANNYDGDVDIDGNPELLSNPFDVTSDGAGGMYFTDSGANTVFHLADDGTLTAFAIFTNRDNPLAGIVGGPTMDQVPTGIARGPDGAVYITTLTGFPFPPGAGRIYRMEDGNGDGDALDEGETTVVSEGITMATDLAFEPDGSILVTQFSNNALEELPGSLVRIAPNGTITTVVEGLITPTAVAVGANGEIYVSQEFAGLVSEVSGATGAPGPAAPGPSDTGNAGLDAGASSGLALLVAALATLILVGSSRLLALRPRRTER